MTEGSRSITILMADDDEDDRLLTKRALAKSHLANDLRFVENGQELMDYLHRRGRFADALTSPRPGLILLDLNMPMKDGREALKEIKADAGLKQIPIVVLTTSREDADIYKTYDLGASSFISKPVTFGGLIDCMQTLGRYWFEIVELPLERGKGPAD
jgi:CheY-like chemotaxis protein